MMRRYVVTALTILGLVGCIVEFVPELGVGAANILVVDGTITDGETVVSLRLSQDLASMDPDVTPTPRPVNNARVWVESEAGQSFMAEEIVEDVEVYYPDRGTVINQVLSGRYRAVTGTLDDNTRYRVRIEAGGEEYVSTWRAPQSTPPIEKMEFHVEGDRIQVMLDVKGEAGGARNYMWNYQETWETRAAINASHYYAQWEGEYLTNRYTYSLYDVMVLGRPVDQFMYPGTVSPFYHCWKYEGSKQVLIADTKRVSENRLRDHVLFEFGVSDDRLSVLYHLRLNQWAIGDDAFEYLNILRENTDNTGSIFSPVPSEMKGNLVCTTSPQTHVIGFVEVSHMVVGEMFLDSAEVPYQPVRIDCRILSMEDIGAMHPPPTEDGVVGNLDYLTVYYLVMSADKDGGGDAISSSTFSTLRCIDCREAGGTKRRPDWWPNDHL